MNGWLRYAHVRPVVDLPRGGITGPYWIRLVRDLSSGLGDTDCVLLRVLATMPPQGMASGGPRVASGPYENRLLTVPGALLATSLSETPKDSPSHGIVAATGRRADTSNPSCDENPMIRVVQPSDLPSLIEPLRSGLRRVCRVFAERSVEDFRWRYLDRPDIGPTVSSLSKTRNYDRLATWSLEPPGPSGSSPLIRTLIGQWWRTS